MSYVGISSVSGERVLQWANESRWFVFSSWISYTVVIMFVAVMVGALALLLYVFWFWYLVQRWFTEYAVTNRRIVWRRGVISRETRELTVPAVESVDLDQTVLGRILGYGTVTVRGRGGVWLVFDRVGGAVNFRRNIQQTIDNCQ